MNTFEYQNFISHETQELFNEARSASGGDPRRAIALLTSALAWAIGSIDNVDVRNWELDRAKSNLEFEVNSVAEACAEPAPSPQEVRVIIGPPVLSTDPAPF